MSSLGKGPIITSRSKQEVLESLALIRMRMQAIAAVDTIDPYDQLHSIWSIAESLVLVTNVVESLLPAEMPAAWHNRRVNQNDAPNYEADRKYHDGQEGVE